MGRVANGSEKSAVTRKMGLLALLCVLPVSSGAQEKAATCSLTIAASLEMRTIDDGRFTVPIQIEGHEYQLMPDTGGYWNTLIPRVVKKEGYRTQQADQNLIGFGSSIMKMFVTVKELGLGRARGHNFDFYVHNGDPRFYDGTLTPQTIAAYDSDFDFAHDKFNLFLPDHCPGKVVYWTREPAAIVPMTLDSSHHIRIPVTIDGKKIMAILDTGATTSVITVTAATRYLGIDNKNPGIKPLNSSGTVFSYPFQTMSFGDISISHPHVEVYPDRAWNDNEMIVGMGVLRQLHLYVAYGEEKLYLTSATAK